MISGIGMPFCGALVNFVFLYIRASHVGATRIKTEDIIGPLLANISADDLLPAVHSHLDLIGFAWPNASHVDAGEVTSSHAQGFAGAFVQTHMNGMTHLGLLSQRFSVPVLGIEVPGPTWLWALALGLTVCFSLAYWKEFATSGQEYTEGRNQYVFENRVVYEWDQTETTITIYARPPGNISMRNIEVVVWPDHIYIGRKGKPPFLEEELYALIDAEGSSWFISPRGELEICLRKVEDGEWPGVILSHSVDESSKPNLPGGRESISNLSWNLPKQN